MWLHIQVQCGTSNERQQKNKRLTVLSEAEQYALYGLPDFDNAQRLEYLALSETELMLAASRPGLHAHVYCILQIGYFKAKHTSSMLIIPGGFKPYGPISVTVHTPPIVTISPGTRGTDQDVAEFDAR